MPYLHWETYERRKKIADIMKEETWKRRSSNHVNDGMREERAKAAEQLLTKHARQLSFGKLSANDLKTQRKDRKVRRSPLADYLLQIARVYNIMDIDPDLRIHRDFLFNQPPLHPRRT